MTELLIGPTSHYFYSQRLKLHYVDWGNHDKPPLVLVHGGRDHSRNWDWVAQELRQDWHIIAPDLRGHGDSEWCVGGNYSMIDYTLDLAQLLNALDCFPVTIIGHSLGGAISLQYTGVYPDRVRKVVAIEGLGPSADPIVDSSDRVRKLEPERVFLPHMLVDRPAPERMGAWIQEMSSLAQRHPHRYKTLDEAVARMQLANPRLTVEQARHLTNHGCYRAEDGSWLWKFDNFVRAVSPYLFSMKDARAIWEEVTCPALLLRGTESWATDPLQDGRAEAFQNAEVVNIEGAGHWVHHDRLEVFLDAVRRFL